MTRFSSLMFAPLLVAPTWYLQDALACPPGWGDVTGNGVVDVADAVCAIQASLADLVGAAADCTATSMSADLTADGHVNVLDVSIAVALALKAALPTAVDHDGNGCLDALEPQCGDGVCEPGETLLDCVVDCSATATCGNGACDPFENITCPQDCGGVVNCPGSGSCTVAQSTPGCSDEACCMAVCGLVTQCCKVAWDAGCASFASQACN